MLLLVVWEWAGRAGMLNPMYAPMPSRIGAALADLFSDGRIWPHLEATFTAALGALTALAACGGDDGSAGPDAGVDAMLGDPDTLVGQFTIDLVAPVPATETEPATEGYTSVLGVVYDKPQPQAIIWDVPPPYAANCNLWRWCARTRRWHRSGSS